MRQFFDPLPQILIKKQPQGHLNEDPEPEPPFQFKAQLHDLLFVIAVDSDVVPEDRVEAVERTHDLTGLCRIAEPEFTLHQEVRGFQMAADLLQLPADEAHRLPVLFIVPIALEFIDLPGDLVEFLLDRGKLRKIFFGLTGRFFLLCAGGCFLCG